MNGLDDFCRQLEAYLCRKNDGHLIRIVGPAFEQVCGWAERGIPLTLAMRGIDRYFERYYSKGPKRRPVRIEFCEADVLDVFDEWRRAVGLSATEPEASPGGSLPAHLQRVVLRLTAARANGSLGDEFDALIDRVARELDAARAESRGIRGDARQALLDRLIALDGELLREARALLDATALSATLREADDELSSFRDRMSPDAYERARDAAVDRLIRNRLALPTIAFA